MSIKDQLIAEQAAVVAAQQALDAANAALAKTQAEFEQAASIFAGLDAIQADAEKFEQVRKDAINSLLDQIRALF
jgi:hypothetical protein